MKGEGSRGPPPDFFLAIFIQNCAILCNNDEYICWDIMTQQEGRKLKLNCRERTCYNVMRAKRAEIFWGNFAFFPNSSKLRSDHFFSRRGQIIYFGMFKVRIFISNKVQAPPPPPHNQMVVPLCHLQCTCFSNHNRIYSLTKYGPLRPKTKDLYLRFPFL